MLSTNIDTKLAINKDKSGINTGTFFIKATINAKIAKINPKIGIILNTNDKKLILQAKADFCFVFWEDSRYCSL